jgi:hypothetical protein
MKIMAIPIVKKPLRIEPSRDVSEILCEVAAIEINTMETRAAATAMVMVKSIFKKVLVLIFFYCVLGSANCPENARIYTAIRLVSNLRDSRLLSKGQKMCSKALAHFEHGGTLLVTSSGKHYRFMEALLRSSFL